MNALQLQRKRNQDGFSLIELLIVVTIILIIAAIAIPKLLTVKQQANATAAVANLRTVGNALNAYASQYPSVGFPPSLTALGDNNGTATTSTSTYANLIDSSLAASATIPKQGYIFTYTPGTATNGGPVTTYTITVTPQSGAGTRYFFTDESGVIRYNDGSAADSTSSIIG